MREERFSTVPIISTILKVLAVVIFLVLLYQSIQGFIEATRSWTQGGVGPFGQPTPAVTGFFNRLLTLLSPLFNLAIGLLIGAATWGFAELFRMVRALVLRFVPPAEPADEAHAA